MRNIIFASALVATATSGIRCGCRADTNYAHADATPARSCPDFVRDAKLATRSVDGGVELTITTPWTVRVAPLRGLLHRLAVVVEDHTQQTDAKDDAELQLPPLRVSIRDVTAGSLMTVKAEHAPGIPLVREQVKVLEELWASSPCINGMKGRVAFADL